MAFSNGQLYDGQPKKERPNDFLKGNDVQFNKAMASLDDQYTDMFSGVSSSSQNEDYLQGLNDL